ncbi:MAG: imidazole glycerol phosphate synthase subunit HisH [Bacillus sp. (in: Bacteria)]|jgi:imidazole glycerol-phosphate synthase subunit HisH|nr:imidazole glycerol phosphate synthase subunit HisH [Bacillus sp. (in: firmicutes)]
MIGIVDYGVGNLFSVQKAFERIGVDAFVSSSIDELKRADGLILPGVGAFKDAMQRLHAQQLVPFLTEYIQERPLLGICLGMQLLFEESEENGLTKGLGFLPGRVVRIPNQTTEGEKVKVPHMGWNALKVASFAPDFQWVNRQYVYFVHSYYVQTDVPALLVATATYEVAIPSIVQKGNVTGMQFHPEKSGEVGQTLLKRFVQSCVRERTCDDISTLSSY